MNTNLIVNDLEIDEIKELSEWYKDPENQKLSLKG
jgi:hypothetical protein